MTLTDPAFWKAAAERAVSTFAQTLGALLGVGVTDLMSVPWEAALSTSALAAVLSVLKSVSANGVGNAGPSLANETITTGRHHRPEPPVIRRVP